MNIKYIDGETRFYFICEACGEPIENLNGVVDFPAFRFLKMSKVLCVFIIVEDVQKLAKKENLTICGAIGI